MSWLEMLYDGGKRAIADFEHAVIKMGLGPRVLPDHIGYRCGTSEEFEGLRAVLEWNSEYCNQSIVSGRRILVVRLTVPFETAFGEILFLELADQKPDGSQKSGFDHLEIVPAGLDVPSSLAAAVVERGVEVIKADRPHHPTYDFRLPSGFKVSIEDEPLIRTIARRDMKLNI